MVDTPTQTITMSTNKPQSLPMSTQLVHRPPNYTYDSLAKNRPAILETDPEKKEEIAPLEEGSTEPEEPSEGKPLPAEANMASSEEPARGEALPTEVAVSPEPAQAANQHCQALVPTAPSEESEEEVVQIPMKEGTVIAVGTEDAWKVVAATGYRDWCVANVAPPNIVKHSWRFQNDESFPMKVHRMLEELDYWGVDCCSWQPHGRAFRVRDKERFVLGGILRKYFLQSKLTSFQRQLNIYGFKRISTGPDKQAYYHELFLRQRPQLAYRIVRFVRKGTRRQPAAPHREPNLYAYPFLPENPTKVNDDSCSVSSDHSSISWTL